MKMTELQTLGLLLVLALASAPIISSLSVLHQFAPRLMTLSQLRRKRLALSVSTAVLAPLALFALTLCRQTTAVLWSGIAAIPVVLLGCAAIRRVRTVIAERVEDPTLEPDSRMQAALGILSAPQRASKVDQWIFGIVVMAVVILTILAWTQI